MPTTVTIKLKDKEGNVRKENYEIEEINLMQFQQMMKILKEVFSTLQEDKALRDLLQGAMSAGREEYESLDMNQLKQIATEAGIQFNSNVKKKDLVDALVIAGGEDNFIPKLTEAFETLAVELPDQATRLLAILSGIPHEKMQQQKLMDVLDIYDAVIEENDIEKLIKRGKKSFASTKAKLTFMNLRKKATQA